ncbi:MAG: hypothetical protein QMB72_05285 [Brachymonas denitrificans]|jgi:uncharacterized membrane protein|uniref:DUF4870 family protein n=1 Tax=Brachymonas denitrificans TaxID=28220 RepID=UPI00201FD4A9|nr:hypothetical protein [Brachymonas denitrificans]
MNDVIDVKARETRQQLPNGTGFGSAAAQADSAALQRAEGLKTVGWISYLLHLIVAVAAVVPGFQVSIALLIVAFVIDLVKKDDAAGTWQESHFSWRIRSVVWAGVLYVVTSPLFLLLLLPGMLAWAIVSIWFLYRIVRGMVAMNDNRPVGV